MLHIIQLTLALGWLTSSVVLGAPVDVIYTGEGCACPTQLGYQLNVPQPPKPKKYVGGEYGYRVDKPVQAKAKISYSFDFTVEEPRTPAPPKYKPSKLYAKVDRMTVNKPDCPAPHEPSCPCGNCAKPRYVDQKPQPEGTKRPFTCKCQKPQCNCGGRTLLARLTFVPLEGSGAGRILSTSTNSPVGSASNAISRSKRDLHSRPGEGRFLRKRLLRQQMHQERPARYVKQYHKDLAAQKKLGLFGLASPAESHPKRKTKKVASSSSHTNSGSSSNGRSRPLARWLQPSRRLSKRDIKGEYDLLERERANIDLTAPEIIQFMPETLDPNFKRGQCHVGCGVIEASAPPTETEAQQSDEQPATREPNTETEANTESEPTPPPPANSIPAKRAAQDYEPTIYAAQDYVNDEGNYRYVTDAQLRTLLSTTSVPDPLEQSGAPLQFAGDLEAPQIWSTAVATPSLLSSNYQSGLGVGVGASVGGRGYPVEHVTNSQLDRIISGIMYKHPDFVDASAHYGGTLVEPEPLQKKQTTDFLRKLIDGRLGGWGFGSEPDSSNPADYIKSPSKTYGFNSQIQNGYNVDTYSSPPITDFLRAWF
ncbi:uncharacterized protein LOC115629808 [Scaptodrosophila lebanonensis]|uniref:Uncharacterized protein LOC115629808 n=1 Tax=Drosophila lebanonensis TaxID=7225 RepID=A0A6J2U0K9_DROLE|nr:uncharacterized protein LOC115629808 [Scaptodrosophila lebanonensis]